MDASPIIRLELQGMKHTLSLALHDYMLTLDEDVQRAIKAYCTPENTTRIIMEEVQRTLNEVIREQVEHFFRYGAGRERVREAVERELNANP